MAGALFAPAHGLQSQGAAAAATWSRRRQLRLGEYDGHILIAPFEPVRDFISESHVLCTVSCRYCTVVVLLRLITFSPQSFMLAGALRLAYVHPYASPSGGFPHVWQCIEAVQLHGFQLILASAASCGQLPSSFRIFCISFRQLISPSSASPLARLPFPSGAPALPSALLFSSAGRPPPYLPPLIFGSPAACCRGADGGL